MFVNMNTPRAPGPPFRLAELLSALSYGLDLA
jgi:hypothetical protein